MNMGEVGSSSSQPGDSKGVNPTVKGRVQCNSSMGLGVQTETCDKGLGSS